MRYAYGVTSALLVGGAAVSVLTGIPAGAQVAQNDATRMEAMVPRAGAPASFAELTQQLQPAVVNIATRQRVRVANGNPFAGTPFEDLFGGGNGVVVDAVAEPVGDVVGAGARSAKRSASSRHRRRAAGERRSDAGNWAG